MFAALIQISGEISDGFHLYLAHPGTSKPSSQLPTHDESGKSCVSVLNEKGQVGDFLFLFCFPFHSLVFLLCFPLWTRLPAFEKAAGFLPSPLPFSLAPASLPLDLGG